MKPVHRINDKQSRLGFFHVRADDVDEPGQSTIVSICEKSQGKCTDLQG